ncbi:hypothetical protein [Pseudomonas urethralis]|uniref:hypothetical protein n=1 Tax=Pseudomonas urethralis TaxID=2740517 RepID=UPI001596619B|nr:hypothetical protein [Pseudomonas urethralis]
MYKNKPLLFLIAALAGCTPLPHKRVAAVDPAKCRAIEGAPARMTRKGKLAYKYVCDGQSVWLTPKY